MSFDSEETVTIINPKNFPFEPRPLETPSPLLNEEPVQPPTSILREDHPIPGIIDNPVITDGFPSESNESTAWPVSVDKIAEDAQTFVVGAVGSLSESMKNGLTKTIDTAKKSYEHARDQCGDVISFMISGSSSTVCEAEKEFSESKKLLREKIESIRAWTDSLNLFDVNNEAQLALDIVNELQDRDMKMKEAWNRFDAARETLEKCYLDSFQSSAKDYSRSASVTSNGSDANIDWVSKRVKVDEEKERVDRFYFVDLRFSKEVVEYIKERLTTAEDLIRRAEGFGRASSSTEVDDQKKEKEKIKEDQEDIKLIAVDIRERLRTLNAIIEGRVKETDRIGSQFSGETVDVAVHKVRQEEEEHRSKLIEADGVEEVSISVTGGQ